jgi:uncharacterized protein YqhQ
MARLSDMAGKRSLALNFAEGIIKNILIWNYFWVIE